MTSLRLRARRHFSQTTQRMRWYLAPSLQSTLSFSLIFFLNFKSCVWMYVSVGRLRERAGPWEFRRKRQRHCCRSYRQFWDVSHGYWEDSSGTVSTLVGWAGQMNSDWLCRAVSTLIGWAGQMNSDWMTRVERPLIGWAIYLLTLISRHGERSNIFVFKL